MVKKIVIHLVESLVTPSPPPHPSGGSGISQTRDVNPPNLGQNSIIWQDFCGKLHENERIWTERQSHVLSVPPPPIGSANVHPPPIISCGYAFHTFTGNFWDLSKILYISCKILYISCKIPYIYRMYAHIR